MIEKAKQYASNRKLSLSRLVEAYLQSPTSDDIEEDIEISPFVKNISPGVSLSSDIDMKKEHNDYLENIL